MKIPGILMPGEYRSVISVIIITISDGEKRSKASQRRTAADGGPRNFRKRSPPPAVAPFVTRPNAVAGEARRTRRTPDETKHEDCQRRQPPRADRANRGRRSRPPARQTAPAKRHNVTPRVFLGGEGKRHD
ncbi:hypothetical protein SKAU_G00203040 [Synaphobranchus kaupii]|uniref:Uncharacterized protein n=1 Tax=Synaphobranchus kaupii TaxID=118154 RepID=A0A9Q1FFU9_SYNKA|nr:hypothetical protein SKAU_G00203040 [Synaphobranchus kaupii]